MISRLELELVVIAALEHITNRSKQELGKWNEMAKLWTGLVLVVNKYLVIFNDSRAVVSIYVLTNICWWLEWGFARVSLSCLLIFTICCAYLVNNLLAAEPNLALSNTLNWDNSIRQLNNDTELILVCESRSFFAAVNLESYKIWSCLDNCALGSIIYCNFSYGLLIILLVFNLFIEGFLRVYWYLY